MLSPLNYHFLSGVVFKPSMDLRHLAIVVFLSLAGIVSHATQPSEDYWQSMLPNTPMPKAIRDLLPSGSGKAGADVITGGPTGVNVGRKVVGVSTGKPVSGPKGGVSAQSGPKGKLGFGKGGISAESGPKGKPVVFNVNPNGFIKNDASVVNPNAFIKYEASVDQLQDDPNMDIFFQEKDLHPGTTMTLHFTKTTPGATFLPRQEAESIPFSSNKISDILHQFSVKPGSKEAQSMKNTIKDCEEPAMEGEDKYCATSLESMIDFSTSKLGTQNVQAVSTEVEKEETQKQQYTITGDVEKMASDEVVVCHDQPYVYAVFYCHSIHSTRTYKVPLVGADGAKANAVAVCHTNTAKWNPKHLTFQVLKVKPGTVPVCRFPPEDHVIWVSE